MHIKIPSIPSTRLQHIHIHVLTQLIHICFALKMFGFFLWKIFWFNLWLKNFWSKDFMVPKRFLLETKFKKFWSHLFWSKHVENVHFFGRKFRWKFCCRKFLDNFFVEKFFSFNISRSITITFIIVLIKNNITPLIFGEHFFGIFSITFLSSEMFWVFIR